MTEIFLSRIEITNFRTFGDFGIDIPAAPGLLLLSGPNGLGKSTFFDGIEWALTGRVSRFVPYLQRGKTSIPEASYLTRRDAKPNTHRIGLKFSEGEAIVRSADSATSDDDILDLIAYPRRGRVADLSTHLALTHFLGQAERQRFTSRLATDQWEVLKGPSGVDRMEEIKTRLRGRSTSLAFGRRVRDEQARVAALEQQIADWQGWQSRAERLRQSVRATGRLSVEEITQRAAEIEGQLHGLLGTKRPGLVGESSSEILVRIEGLIAYALEQLSARETWLSDVPSLLETYHSATVAASNDQPLLLRLRKDAADRAAAVAAASERVTATGKERSGQSGIVSRLETEVSQLEATRADMVRRVEVAEQLLAANAELTTFKNNADRQREAIAEVDGVLAAHTETAKKVLQLRVLSDQANALFHDYQSMLRLEAAAEIQATALKDVLAEAETSASEYAARISEQQTVAQNIEVARLSVEEAQRHATAIASAVAALAAHIHEADTICPVCQSEFPQGELKLLADAAATSGDASLQSAQQQLEDLVRTELATSQSVRTLRAIVVDMPATLREAEARARTEARDARASLLQKLELDAVVDPGEVVVARKDAAAASLADAQRRLEELDASAAGARERRVDLLLDLETLIRRQATAAQRVTDLEVEDRSCAERVASRALIVQTTAEAEELLSKTRVDLEAGRARSTDLDALGNVHDRELKDAQAALANAEKMLREAETARSQAEAEVERLAGSWTALNLPGTPGRSTLDGALESIRQRRASLANLESRRADLAVSNQNSVLDEELAVLERQMVEAGGDEAMSDPSGHVGRLRQKVAAANAAVKLSQGAHEAVNRYTARLAEKTEGYNEAILKPLNQRILEFNAAMLSTPGASVQFGANARVDRTDFEMGLHYNDAIVDSFESAKGLDPRLVLSEGQMAANGFSILCATSTAYRWSRWRALLLDDPLQHNDIIHTAAFVDVMRNLVEEEKYQLVMSSHDRAESDFIGRKFDAAGLSCTTVYLTAPSDAGVAYEAPQYNDPARALMASHLSGLASEAGGAG